MSNGFSMTMPSDLPTDKGDLFVQFTGWRKTAKGFVLEDAVVKYRAQDGWYDWHPPQPDIFQYDNSLKYGDAQGHADMMTNPAKLTHTTKNGKVFWNIHPIQGKEMAPKMTESKSRSQGYGSKGGGQGEVEITLDQQKEIVGEIVAGLMEVAGAAGIEDPAIVLRSPVLSKMLGIASFGYRISQDSIRQAIGGSDGSHDTKSEPPAGEPESDPVIDDDIPF